MFGRGHLFATFMCFGWLISFGCGGDPAGPLPDGDGQDLEASRLPYVEDFEPTSAVPGSRIALHVHGENFDEGSHVDLLLSGNAVDEVHTLSTVLVTPEELVADISIAPDAALGSYQIQVTTSGGKRGIPIENFSVVDSTSAVRLEFTSHPGTALAGLYFSTPIQVIARNSAGEVDHGFTGTISIALAQPSSGSLIGRTSARAVRGVANFFGDLVIHEVGDGYRVVATATGLNPATSAAFDVRPAGRIAFVSDRDGTSKIYVMNADGSGLTRLTDGAEADSRPAWSPDGRRIAFARGHDRRMGWSEVDNDTCGIYVMNADGSDLTRLTTSCGDGWPAWSPDGTRIAFGKWIWEGLDNGLYVMNADGSGVDRLTEVPGVGLDQYPTWSPDGQKIAFNRSLDLDGIFPDNIYVMNADGSGIHKLTLDENPRFAEGCPAWSPDDSRIVFWSFGYGIATVDSHGGFPSTIHGGGEFSGNVHFFSCPTWSPDGRNIVFARERTSSSFLERRLVIANATGQGLLQPLPRNSTQGEDYEPAWSRVSQ